MLKDTRKVYYNHTIAAAGNTWSIDAKFNPETKRLKVYRIYGDITTEAYKEALQNFALEIGAEHVLVFGRWLK